MRKILYQWNYCNSKNIIPSCSRDKSRLVPTAQKIKSLSELMGAFKTTSSKLIHKNELKLFKWQRLFYDHVIRNEKSLYGIRKYIQNNSINWTLDRNNMDNENL